MRKVVQMVNNNGVLFVAADDGTVWWWGTNGWEAAPDLPTEPTPLQRLERKQEIARYRYRAHFAHVPMKQTDVVLPAPPDDESGLDEWFVLADAYDEKRREEFKKGGGK